MSEHEAPAAHEWETALERLELQVSRAERMGTGLDAKELENSLPASLSTIPRYLLDRAQSLVERQQRLEITYSEPPIQPPVRTGNLHERVGHLITGPREPVSFEVFGSLVEGEPEQD
jgi:hypothetical protein